MKKTVLVVCAFALLLIIPPTLMMITGWHWSPENQFHSIKWLLWLTNTAGAPYSILTSLLFLGAVVLVFRSKKKQCLKILLILISVVLLQQGLKSALKNTFKEPRPYVEWLASEYQIPTSDFYELKRSIRAKLIKDTVKQDENVPKWQRKHWQAETGYSFPSGHMLFAAGWALFLIALFWQQRLYALSIGLAIWAEGIAFSRMLLGMHWPIDIITSVVISACFTVFGYYILRLWGLLSKAD
ncbi:phosphatase PAP2 family protein [Providencia rettgeri]|uniref:phosphatase PAP2 family protein n=1 Tax=Providencia TaxID=586 RepID=UPI001BD6337D|nr:phosphatase PAP2 family protein [Providencia rettgeri]ELR5068611.1 phosphatase PAP2 family protein [Providencia rettgeri]ELR5221491.1 phosphatase PAP2 family protein [Providencia rettgeri]MDX7321421.1 phosphatase PAP2 family protein [Providencia rettgeri]